MDMNDVNNTTAGADTGVTNTGEDTNQYIIKFNKPYNFEGQEYNEVDLSNLENISTKDLIATDKIFYSTGSIAPQVEVTMAYTCIIASKVSNKSLEFFYQLPAKEGIKVKTMVTSFLYN